MAARFLFHNRNSLQTKRTADNPILRLSVVLSFYAAGNFCERYYLMGFSPDFA